MKIRPVGAELFYADGQTDTMNLIDFFFAILLTRPIRRTWNNKYFVLLDLEHSKQVAFVLSPYCKTYAHRSWRERCYLVGAIYIFRILPFLRFLIAVLLKIRVSRNIKFCRMVSGYRSFKESYTVIRIYTNVKYQSKHNHLLYNYHLWTTCFDSLESSSGPTKNRSKVI
jgi:hypothetical protein